MGKRALVFALAYLAMVGCSKKDDSSTAATVDAAKPSTVIASIDSKVSGVGSGLEGVSAFATVDSQCDSHAVPQDSGSQMSQSHQQYPLKYFYCMIMKNTGSPDSVSGSYTLVKSLSCALESAGQLTYDGASHSATVAIATPCFTAAQIASMGVTSVSATITASHPAAFNTNFDYGVSMDVTGFGTFKFATKVSGSTISFIAMEDQSANHPNKTGAYGASYDTTTGVLYFEGRHDRYACTESGSCGWSRHQRIYANLALNASGDVTGVEDFSGVATDISNMSAPPYQGTAVSMKGNLTDGLKARAWTYSNTTEGNLDEKASYTETTANTYCFTSSSDTGPCTGNSGIDLPAGTNNKFFMLPSGSGGSAYTSPTTWFGSVTGFTFTAADFVDTQ